MKRKNKFTAIFLIVLSILLFSAAMVFTDEIALTTILPDTSDCLWGKSENNDIYAKNSLSGGGVAIGRDTADGRPFSVVAAPVAYGANRAVAAFMDNSPLPLDPGTRIGGGIEFTGHNTATGYAEWAGIAGIKANEISGNTAGEMAFMTRANGSATTERIRITSSGNVGIGTVIPGEKLQVNGSIALKDSAAAGDGPNLRLYESSSSTTPWEIDSYNSTAPPIIGGPWLRFSRGISTDPTRTKMMITSAGNVGIGRDPDVNGAPDYNGVYRLAVDGAGSGDVKKSLFVVGNVMIFGDCYLRGAVVTPSGKLFKIDHPTKPGMKLIHATMEGPEAAVFYRGKAKLKSGRAVVELPDYFEALTRKDSRTVQLSAEGQGFFPLSYTDIVNGKFTVYGTKPDGEFCWEVTAVRADIEPLVVEEAIEKQ